MGRVRAPAVLRRGPRAKPGERSARVHPSGASACEPGSSGRHGAGSGPGQYHTGCRGGVCPSGRL